MDNSKKILIKKTSVVLGPVLLILLAMHFFMSSLRQDMTKATLGLEVYESEGLEVFARNKKLSKQIARDFKSFRAFFRKTLSDHLELDRLPTTRIHVFPDEESYQQYYQNKWQETIKNNPGYYDPTDGIIAIQEKTEYAHIRRAIRHEAVHLFLHTGSGTSNPEWSPWFNEGFATVFESARETEHGLTTKLFNPYFINDIQKLFENKKWVPVGKLLEVTEEAFKSEDNTKYYYESGLLVFYLLNTYPEAFWRYFNYEKQAGSTGPEAFERIFNRSPEQMDHEIQNWFERRSY